MSDFTKSFTVTFTSGGSVNSVSAFAFDLPDCVIEEIIITWPAGCAGMVNIAIYAGGSPAYPNDYGAYMAFDDYTLVQEVSNQITTGDWSVVGYNSDIYDHAIQFVFKANYLQVSPSDIQFSPVVSL